MSKGLDYSKWDKMVADMSSSEDENNEQHYLPNNNKNDNIIYDKELSSKRTNVTRLKKPSSVTIGPNGVTINPKINNNNKVRNKQNVNNTKSLHQKQKTLSSPISGIGLSSLLKQWTHNGGIHNFDYLWTQSADELIIRFLIPINTRSKNVKIGFNAIKKEFSCKITVNNHEMSLNKTFTRKLKESTEEEAKLDWELSNIDAFYYDSNKIKKTLKGILCLDDNDKNNDNKFIEYINKLKQSRFLKITLEKERINNRIIEWWDSVFINDTKIDLKRRVKDRKTDSKQMNNIWNKAHEQFGKYVANIKPTEIYIPPDDIDSEDDNLDTLDID